MLHCDTKDQIRKYSFNSASNSLVDKCWIKQMITVFMETASMLVSVNTKMKNMLPLCSRRMYKNIAIKLTEQ